ncbi:MAG TPA: Ig-like domain-containing protein, partial [Thermoanaerobaculia bacterium]
MGRKSGRCSLGLAVLSFISLLVILGASPQAGAVAPAGDDALWVAESAGALKISTADGSLLFEIRDIGSVRAVAVDHVRATVWLYAERTLAAYSFAGHRTLSIPVPGVLPVPLPLTPNANLAVHESDGSILLGYGRNLRSFSSSGQSLFSVQTPADIQCLGIDQGRSLLWAGTAGAALSYDAVTGALVRSLPVPGLKDLDVDSRSGDVWVAWRDGLRRYGSDGTLLLDAALRPVPLVAAGPQGDVWTGTTKEIRHLDATGRVLASIRPFDGQGDIVELVVNPRDGSVWVASQKNIAQVSAAGQRLHLMEVRPLVRVWDLAIYADVTPPEITILDPRSGAFLNTASPAFQVSYGDVGSGVDPASLAVRVNGSPVTVSCAPRAGGATCTPASPLPEGPAAVTATVRDFAGNTSAPAQVAFAVDTVAPRVVVTQPAPGALTRQRQQSFLGTVSEPAALTLNGADVAVASDGSFQSPPVSLQEGSNSFALIARDRAGNTGQALVTVTLDTTAPAAVDPARVTVSVGGDGRVQVSAAAGATEPGAAVAVTNARTGETVHTTAGTDGGFSVSLAGRGGDHLSLIATDAAGNPSAPAGVIVPGSSGTDGLPPDPATVATPLDRTVATDIAAATAFLYSGDHPIQSGVAPGAIDPKRVAVLRGRVVDRDGAPVPGARVTILGHAEFGGTLSRADGAFDLAVNGGGLTTITFEKTGFPGVQRQVDAPWRDYAVLADTILVPFDPAVTTIASGAATLQVARGSAVSDADGPRRVTLLFPAGVTARLVHADGSGDPLPSLSVRATEYTVGPNGPRAMPGPLPANVGYTWAAELSVDEAVAAGAERVEFSAPVSLYVENFLGFPVGGPVPTGFYDRRAAAWMGSDNGRVIAILGTDASGLARLDVDGGGQPADDAALAALAITTDERRVLAGLYSPGQSLWRVPIPHFSPWDCNWPYGPPSDAEEPPGDDSAQDEGQKDDDNDCTSGSIIECQSQVLGEQVGVLGTPFSLTYRSDEVPGRTALFTAKVKVTGATVPASLRRVDVELEIAGRRFLQSFPPQPNQAYTFTWDGRDAYGRLVQGAAQLNLTKTYVYDLVYLSPLALQQSWARFPDGSYGAVSRSRQGGEIQLVRRLTRSLQDIARTTLGGWDARALGLGGWRLNVHHSYDPASQTLHLGSGERRSASSLPRLLYRAVGTGEGGDGGDGGRAELAQLSAPDGLTFGSDGSLYVADRFNHRIRRVDPHGTITTLAGDGAPCQPDYSGGGAADCGEGVAATAAHLREPAAVAVGTDGSIWIADTGNNCVRRVDPAGVISTVAGVCDGGGNFVGTIAARPGKTAATSGRSIQALAADCEDCPGTARALKSPIDLALAPDGGLYIDDFEHDRILYLDRDGRIRTVVGGGVPSGGIGDGGAARDADLFRPQGIALGRDGSLYIAQPYYSLVRRVGPDGVITTVAGDVNAPQYYCGDGGPATGACLSFPTRLAATPDGGLLIADTNNQIVRWVAPSGLISTVAGTPQGGPSFSVNGAAAQGVALDYVRGIAVAPDGAFYLSVFGAVFRQSPALPGFTSGTFNIPDRTGSEMYVFDSSGRHLQTIDPLTRAPLYTFDYDANGLLTAVHDVDGKLTRIERSATGAPAALVGPFGQRTEVGLDGDGYLRQVKNPAGEQIGFTYGVGGLLESSQDARGAQSHYEYFGFGSLTGARDRAGAEKTLVRTAASGGLYFVDLTSGMGRKTRFQNQRFENGSRFTARTDPSGEITVHSWNRDGSEGTDLPDGTSMTATAAPDPRWGLLGPVPGSLQLSTPGGLSWQVSTQRAVLLANPDDPLAIDSIVDTTTV